jgi:hypothetical protein
MIKTLEDDLWKAANEIVSGLATGTVLTQASHAPELAAQEGWDKVIGVGYSDKQRRDLIYRHLANVSASVRKVTGADPIMAKQLVDLLHARVHAGEQRRVCEATLVAQRDDRLCQAITGSIAEFLTGLHAAGGGGRYNVKITKLMQVCASPSVPPAPPAARTRSHPLTTRCRARPPAGARRWSQLL